MRLQVNDGGSVPVKIVVNGREYTAESIAKLGKDEIALLISDLVKAGWKLQQALQLFPGRVSYSYCLTAVHLSAGERFLIDSGVHSLSDFHNTSRADARIDKLIAKYGNRIVERHDEMTKPSAIAAE